MGSQVYGGKKDGPAERGGPGGGRPPVLVGLKKVLGHNSAVIQSSQTAAAAAHAAEAAASSSLSPTIGAYNNISKANRNSQQAVAGDIEGNVHQAVLGKHQMHVVMARGKALPRCC